MAKYDCSKAKDFLHELKRASEWCRKRSASEYKKCEMVCGNGSCFASLARNLNNISENQFDYVIQRMQNWSDSHPENRELTEDEISILKAFKALGFNYIAADKNGCVCTYIQKPRKGERMWCNTSMNYASNTFGGKSRKTAWKILRKQCFIWIITSN